MQELRRTGLTILKNVPRNISGLESVTRLVGNVKWTHYGHFWNGEDQIDRKYL